MTSSEYKFCLYRKPILFYNTHTYTVRPARPEQSGSFAPLSAHESHAKSQEAGFSLLTQSRVQNIIICLLLKTTNRFHIIYTYTFFSYTHTPTHTYKHILHLTCKKVISANDNIFCLMPWTQEKKNTKNHILNNKKARIYPGAAEHIGGHIIQNQYFHPFSHRL